MPVLPPRDAKTASIALAITKDRVGRLNSVTPYPFNTWPLMRQVLRLAPAATIGPFLHRPEGPVWLCRPSSGNRSRGAHRFLCPPTITASLAPPTSRPTPDAAARIVIL